MRDSPYPIMEKTTSIFPGGILRITKFPSKSEAVPNPIEGMITLHPMRGSFVTTSVIVPVILPVVPAERAEINTPVKNNTVNDFRIIFLAPELYQHGFEQKLSL